MSGTEVLLKGDPMEVDTRKLEAKARSPTAFGRRSKRTTDFSASQKLDSILHVLTRKFFFPSSSRTARALNPSSNPRIHAEMRHHFLHPILFASAVTAAS